MKYTVSPEIHHLPRPKGGDTLAAQKGEAEEGIAAADACIAAGVKHIIYSTLDEVAEGACAHFESKAAVPNYIQEKKYPYTNLGMLHRIYRG
ncbi:hypothetical protein B9479_005005 [Cryptococcus floricola]|uniref:NmrA-like domain-containing protein n=1 Tax=Cryptococcus floricola TaxID=2591691 RepID=A0A5D3AW64_9TREE|nr:hypothetical protein B9479_005005 [Cryptococcus floricola]